MEAGSAPAWEASVAFARVVSAEPGDSGRSWKTGMARQPACWLVGGAADPEAWGWDVLKEGAAIDWDGGETEGRTRGSELGRESETPATHPSRKGGWSPVQGRCGAGSSGGLAGLQLTFRAPGPPGVLSGATRGEERSRPTWADRGRVP